MPGILEDAQDGTDQCDSLMQGLRSADQLTPIASIAPNFPSCEPSKGEMQKSEPLHASARNLVSPCPHNSQMKCTITSWAPPWPQVCASRAQGGHIQNSGFSSPEHSVHSSRMNSSTSVTEPMQGRKGTGCDSGTLGLNNFTIVALEPSRNRSKMPAANVKQSSRDETHACPQSLQRPDFPLPLSPAPLGLVSVLAAEAL